MDNDAEGYFSDHKLSGYLFAVLSLSSAPEKALAFGTRCRVSQNDAALVTECGVVLAPAPAQNDVASHTRENSASRKKKRLGMVNGSMSIVHQIHALVMNNCLKIDARVVDGGGGGEEGSVVVLVDVYLPLEALFGDWQFPKIGVVAGAVFRHLSCDWTARSLSLSKQEDHKDIQRCLKSSCGLSVCHVLGCKLHHDATASSKSTLFDLSEIFKSLPSVAKKVETYYSRVKPVHDICESGIWDLSDDILLKMLTVLAPIDLARTAATCRHLRSVSSSIMPSMKLKLFPHQQAAIDWMMQRERNEEEFLHPLYKKFSTEDGITYYVNTVSGEIVNGVAPTIKDFCGGMFCDEPGLGKTITALSLILKTQGTLPNPPPGTKVIWCTHNGDKRCGYYELNGNTTDTTPWKNRAAGESVRSRPMTLESIIHDEFEYTSSKRTKLAACNVKNFGIGDSCLSDGMRTPTYDCPVSATSSLRNTRSVSIVKKNLLHDLSGEFSFSRGRKSGRNPRGKKQISNIQTDVSNDTWVQCDACNKWRKLACNNSADVSAAWFCSMNSNPLYQCCSAPEESWDNHSPITYFPGYCTKDSSRCLESNVTYFVNVLRENSNLINSETKKALKWLANLSPDDLFEIERRGLRGPFVSTSVVSERVSQGFHKIFQAFGLVKSVQKGVVSWHYPPSLENLAFDVGALRTALCEPLDSVRLYMSKATLIVVPANLVDHWKTQIEKHVRPRQLRLFVWTDYRKPAAHILAWDYDVVITTFNRLSAEWGPHKKSVLMQVHWRRIMLDEGHTLGASLALTNKLQMAISLVASSRWILTGTPTPNTPSSQLSHLLPIIKFLHEEAYGKNQKSWEDGILRPFEAEMEEGKLRLLELLNRCMISARKIDLKTIPPCIKKVTYLEFTENHVRSYNELVVTVRRNILMADWNDPSHVESLLNRKQWKLRSTTLRNVRLSCCVAGQIKVTCAGEDIQETMDILVANSLDPASEEYAFIKYSLSYGGTCFRCKEWCRLPIITPCRHLLCIDCVALSSEQCSVPGCGYHYEMQTPDTRPENPNPKWPVPKDLIELQPSYKQDDWHPDWQSTSSSKVSYLINRLVELHKGNETIDAMDESTDSRHLESDNKNLVKVIIFSQFLEHMHVIEQQLTFADIGFAGMYSPLHSAKKLNSLAKFQHDANCMALVMDGSAALGLDLSFVTHVFLMEPIWDRSVEEQVISRAHRMGATRPINVETLAMRGTIEEQMLQCLQDADGYRRVLKVGNGISDNEGSRAHRSLHEFAESNYLSQLTSVLTNHQK